MKYTIPILLYLGCAILLGLIATGSASAIDLEVEHKLPAANALKAARAAVAKCERDGYHVSAAVVDGGGNVQALLRGDGAGPHTTDSSARKAYTSASLGRPTQELAQLIVKVPAVQGLRDMNEKILILGGGLPIKINGGLVGGIGVGGAPGGHLDEACARAGLEAIGLAPAPQAGQP